MLMPVLATLIPRQTSDYPYLQVMKSSVTRAVTGRGQVGACSKAGGAGGGGPSLALGMREDFLE